MEDATGTSNKPEFSFPRIEAEGGEIERTAREFLNIENEEEIKVFLIHFKEIARGTSPIELSDEIWSKLNNTDSYDIEVGDWNAVDYHATAEHQDLPRDWQSLKLKMEQGEPLDAPIIAKKGDSLHLVCGNTRLMVARALGIRPKVLIVDVEEG